VDFQVLTTPAAAMSDASDASAAGDGMPTGLKLPQGA
jgi:hypothetical protein